MKATGKIALLAFLSLLCAWNIHVGAVLLYRRRKRCGRRWWMHPETKSRDQFGAFETVFLKHKTTDHERFFKLTRMTVDVFDELLTKVSPLLQKNSYRKYLTPEFRLALTVCYLASGNGLPSMATYWKIGKSTAYYVVHETCEAIWTCLKISHLAPPTPEQWKDIAAEFWDRWNFPNCVGAPDGKHVRVQCPTNSGSAFFNYKQYFSLVLLDICDANCFTWVDIGDYGSLPDSSVCTASSFGTALEEGALNFPPPAALPGTNETVPFYIVADEAFPLRPDLMRPYPRRNLTSDKERVFNYRLSRARLTIENSFGVLASRWRVMRTTLGLQPKSVESIVLATVCLHNFIMKREKHIAGFKSYCPPTYVDHLDDDGNIVHGEWRRGGQARNFENLGRIGANRGAAAAVTQRDTFAEYVVSEVGHVAWQWGVVNRGFNINVPL